MSDGTHKTITGAITVDEGVRMARQILERGFVTALETGVAFGVSTLAICLALEESGQSTSVHFGVDPDQTTTVAQGSGALAAPGARGCPPISIAGRVHA